MKAKRPPVEQTSESMLLEQQAIAQAGSDSAENTVITGAQAVLEQASSDSAAVQESQAGPQDADEDEFDSARAQVASQTEVTPVLQATPASQKTSRNSTQSKQSEQTSLQQEGLDAMRVIEAALFLSNKPLAYPELALIAKTSVKKAKEVAEKLALQYTERDSSIELVCDASQATMQVKGNYLAPVAQLSKNIEMTRKATRMLALVAKKGKFLQSELKKYFRGDIYTYIAELKELGYISSEKSGNTRMLKVTEKFRENFQLGSTGEQALQAAAAKAEAEVAAQDAAVKAEAEKV